MAARTKLPPLLTLPRELRDVIYTFVLAPTGWIEFYSGKGEDHRLVVRPSCPPMSVPYTSTWPNTTLSLLETSIQFYEEAKSWFWEHNQIKFMCRTFEIWRFPPDPARYVGQVQLWQHTWIENAVHIHVYYTYIYRVQLKLMLSFLKRCKKSKNLTLRNGFEHRKRRCVWVKGDDLDGFINFWDVSRSPFIQLESLLKSAVESEGSVLPSVNKKLVFDELLLDLEWPKIKRERFEWLWNVRVDWTLVDLPLIFTRLFLSLGSTGTELWYQDMLCGKDSIIDPKLESLMRRPLGRRKGKHLKE